MEILRSAMAGSVESNDILVKVSNGEGVVIDLQSQFEKQYGDDIREVIKNTVDELGVENILIEATDKGAIDFTIKARVKTAIKRASKED